jgi:hypothetical protein
LDASGKSQGPFNNSQMVMWYDIGQLPLHLQVHPRRLSAQVAGNLLVCLTQVRPEGNGGEMTTVSELCAANTFHPFAHYKELDAVEALAKRKSERLYEEEQVKQAMKPASLVGDYGDDSDDDE